MNPTNKNNNEEKPETRAGIRINKYLALENYATRKGADELIIKKKVFINGRLAVLGDKVEEGDQVEVKGVKNKKELVYFAYNKPRGVVTHSATNTSKSISDYFPVKGIFPIGRLDKDSHGLIILTNDGRVTDRLLSPKYEHDKEYIVVTKEKLRSSFKQKMEAGVNIEGDMTRECEVEIMGENKFKVILTEGKKHQIRRMCVALFQEVSELKRVRIMNIRLGSMKPGEYRKIEGLELMKFLQLLKLI